MEKLSNNFSRSEFQCKGENCCGKSAPVHPDLVDGLQELRDRVKRSLIINSGFRCRRHNKEIRGEENSFHTLGMAADVACPKGMTPYELATIAVKIPQFRDGGIGIYQSWIHVDVRKSGRARW